MKYYVISDTHFNHDDIVGYCERPADHEKRIMHNLMAVAAPSHCLIHLGDFALGMEAKWSVELNKHWVGRKILIMGNHDSKSASWYMEHGWDFVCDSFRLKYAGKIIHFSHKPESWDGVWEINVHGHLHNLGHRNKDFKELKKWHRLYAPELMGYRPIELSKFIQTEPKEIKKDDTT